MKTKVKASRLVFRCPLIERHQSHVRVLRDNGGWGAWDYKEKGAHLNGVI